MNKILKIFSIILTNIFLFLILFFLLEFIIYFLNSFKNFKFEQPFQYVFDKNFVYKNEFSENFKGGESGRLPDGLKYKNKPPIFVFGCSCTYGQYLNDNQTFSYKLSNILKRTVYNRALPGFGVQHFYRQVSSDEFYLDKPCPETVLYIMIDDHYNRALVKTPAISINNFYLNYKVENNKLKYNFSGNIVRNFFDSLYISRFINHKSAYYYINNKKNADELTDLMCLYFTESKNELEKHYNKKINLYVIFYPEIKYRDLLAKKLADNNIKTIDIGELFPDIDFALPEYMQNWHPTEKVWDIVTPVIAKIIQDKNS